MHFKVRKQRAIKIDHENQILAKKLYDAKSELNMDAFKKHQYLYEKVKGMLKKKLLPPLPQPKIERISSNLCTDKSNSVIINQNIGDKNDLMKVSIPINNNLIPNEISQGKIYTL